MNHTRATLLGITFTGQAAPETEVSVLSLDPVGGKSVGEGRRKEVSLRKGERDRERERLKQYWQVSTHKVTGKTAHEAQSILPPPKFTV